MDSITYDRGASMTLHLVQNPWKWHHSSRLSSCLKGFWIVPVAPSFVSHSAMWRPEGGVCAALLCSSLWVVVEHTRGGTSWVWGRGENWREPGDSNEWAIVRETEQRLFGRLCHQKWGKKWKHISPLTASVDLTPRPPLCRAPYDVVRRRGGPRGCPRGSLFLVRD